MVSDYDSVIRVAGVRFAAWGASNVIGPGMGDVMPATEALGLPVLIGAAACASAGAVFLIGLGRIQRVRAVPAAHAE